MALQGNLNDFTVSEILQLLGTQKKTGCLLMKRDAETVVIYVSDGRVVSARGSATAQRHTHTFGPVTEEDDHRTLFGEVSVTGTTGRHTWVAGGAVQTDRFESKLKPLVSP